MAREQVKPTFYQKKQSSERVTLHHGLGLSFCDKGTPNTTDPASQTTADWLADLEATAEAREKSRKPAPKHRRTPDNEAVKHAQAAKLACHAVASARNGTAPYSAKEKGITVPHLVSGKTIIVPMYCATTDELVNVQRISTGKKLFGSRDPDYRNWTADPDATGWNGGKMGSTYHQFGGNNKTLIVAEGWATGARVHQITGCSVRVVFSASNLAKFKKPAWCERLLIATDNDKSRAGEQAAEKLQARYPGTVSVLPPTIGTDWADYTADEVTLYWREHLPLERIICEQYLPAHILSLSDHTVIRSPHGTGKTTTVIDWIDQQTSTGSSVLYVCHGRAQVSDMVQRLNAKCSRRFDDYRHIDDVNCSSRLVICVDSLCKVQQRFDVIVFDECEQLTETPLKHDLHAAKRNQCARKELAHHMAWLARNAERSLWLDADAGALTQQFITHSGIKPLWIENTYQPLQGAKLEFVGLDELTNRLTADTGQWHLYCSSRKTAKAMHKRHGGTLATGETCNQALIADIANGKPITGNLVSNSALQSGVSIDKNQMKTVYARIRTGKGLPSLEAQMQGLRRARGVQKFVICIESKPPMQPHCTDPDRIVYEEITEPRLHNNLWLKRNEFMTSSALTGISTDAMLSDLYGQYKAKLHHQWNNPQQWVIDRFKQLGAIFIDSRNPDDDGAKTRQADKLSREEIKTDDLHTIATAYIPTEQEHAEGIKNPALAALAAAKHENDVDELEARKLAQREYLKPGYLKGLERCSRDMQAATVHAREDEERTATGDPLNKPRSELVAMRKEVIGLCAHVLDGREFSAADLESVLRPWLIENGCLFAKMNGRRCGNPAKMRAAQTIVSLLEHYGIWIDRVNGKQKRYSVNTNDPRNVAAVRMLVTYCISNNNKTALGHRENVA